MATQPDEPNASRITRLGGFLCGAALLAGCGPKERAPRHPYRHVVLISLDTFRADHLGCYGSEAVETPRIDELAARSTLFTDVTSAAPTTLAAHTSIMTGLTPRSHGVVRNGFVVNGENHMLAEILADEGFLCGAVLGSFALDKHFDFDQGFHHFDADFDLLLDVQNFDQNQRRAAAVTDAALAFVDDAGGAEQLFLFAHYFDAHAPYNPPEPWNRRYAESGWRSAGTQADVEGAANVQRRAALGRDDVPTTAQAFRQGLTRELLTGGTRQPRGIDRELAALYAGEVGYLDHHVGRLLDGLEERGILDEAIVVLTGDHGETFWEHGDFWNHGLWVYDTTLRVPLILHMPDGRGAGLVSATPVSPIDVVPTLAELLGIALPEPVEGHSLAAALDGAEPAARPIFSEATQPVGLQVPSGGWPLDPLPKSVRSGPWKYVVAPYLGYEELFHTERDPAEHTNLLRSPSPGLSARRDELRAELEHWLRSRTPRASQYNSAQAQEVRTRLRELGYVDSGHDADEEDR